ncbi:MAG: SAM-dependent methyltransferase [Nocardiopsaceae bacterium]|nr:SAM-dependent methyltransferase [Nocardiopsaceae bacterium]
MRDEQVSMGFDITTPNVARVYNYHIGGKDNFAVDREVGDQILRLVPEARESGREHRAFLRRMVKYLTGDAGVRQFIDIGSGLPSAGNVHEVAREIDPTVRVVYADNDPMVVLHAKVLIGATSTTRILEADLRDPDTILASAAEGGFIDFSQPVGLLLLAIVHHIPDSDDPARIMGRLRAALPPGSYLAISHFCNPGAERPEDAELAAASERLFTEKFGTGRWRTPEEITSYFGDFRLLEPGLVPLPQWRPETPGGWKLSRGFYQFIGGVARRDS